VSISASTSVLSVVVKFSFLGFGVFWASIIPISFVLCEVTSVGRMMSSCWRLVPCVTTSAHDGLCMSSCRVSVLAAGAVLVLMSLLVTAVARGRLALLRYEYPCTRYHVWW
jgi:hypothetical protein